MSTTTRQSANRQSETVRRYVNSQLEKTRRQVKTDSLIASALSWVVGLVVFFLVLTLIDAWIVPLSTVARWTAFAVLVIGTAAWFLVSLLPLLRRRINPDYAARMIEQSQADFKNSILNYVWLRKKPEQVNAAVLDVVSRKAATDLNAVPGESIVDRSRLIRIGFMLVGVMIVAVAYKMLSPKDPLQTIQRVLFPGSRIAKPAAVQILDVDPGDCQLFFGDRLLVTAKVRGNHDPEDVRVVFSTTDGQTIDQAVPMQPTDVGGKYQCDINPNGAGVQQSLRYRIEARDGVTEDYHVSVRPNPSIAIESITLTPPTYTGLPPRTTAGFGDIEAVEGTEAMLHVAANLPIKVAYIELLKQADDRSDETDDDRRYQAAAPPVEMRLLDDQHASGRFTVAMNSRRSGPLASHYRIRFVSQSDDRNDKPNVYPIRVIPDLAPEVRIVQPSERDSSTPVNRPLEIRIEANDLDFEISSVRLEIDHQGRRLRSEELPLEPTAAQDKLQPNQRVTSRYRFDPARLRLQPGDQAVFHAVVADNRVSMRSLQPDPNITQSDNYTILITDAVEPDPQQQTADNEKDPGERSQDGEKETDEQQPAGDDGQQGNDSGQQEGDQQSKDGQESSDGANPMDQQNPDQPESSNKDPQDSSDGSNGDQSGDGDADSANDNGDENSGQQRGGSEGGSEADSSSQANHSDAGSESGTGEGQDSQNPQSGNGQNQDGNPDPSANDNNSQRPQSDPENDGTAGDPADGEGSPDDSNSQYDPSLKDGQRDKLHDNASEGEQFDKLQELLDEQSEKSGRSQPAESDSGDLPQSEAQPNQQPQNPGQPDDQSPNPQTGEAPSSSGDPADRGDPGDQSSSTSQDQQASETGNQGSPSPSDSNDAAQSASGEGSQQAGDSHGQQPSNDDSQSAGEGTQPSRSGSETENAAASGSTEDDSQQGDAPQPGDQPTGEPSERGTANNSTDTQTTPDGAQPGQPDPSAGPVGQGTSGNDADGDLLDAEQANLDHARKATDLILNKLSDQQYDPDPELLDRMNWTQDDLKQFLDRWQRMKAKAETGDPDAVRQYEQAVRSLGLNPNRDRRTIQQSNDDASGLNQDSAVIEPPPELAPDFNEFLRDRNRVR